MPVLSSSVAKKVSAAHKPAAVPSSKNTDFEPVRAELARAGLPQPRVNTILKRYPHYAGWDFANRFRPAICQWQAGVGRETFVSLLILNPGLLLYSHKQYAELQVWLSSAGVRPHVVSKKALSALVSTDLDAMKAKVSMLEQRAFKIEMLSKLLQRHPMLLMHSIDHIDDTIETIARLIECPVGSPELLKVLLACPNRLFSMSPETIHARISHLRNIGFSVTHLKGAVTSQVYGVSVVDVNARLQYVMEALDVDRKKAVDLLSAASAILVMRPSTLDAHKVAVQEALALNAEQVRQVYFKEPDQLGRNMNSSVYRLKVSFLLNVMHATADLIVERPRLLINSLNKRLGPRFSFLLSLAAQDVLQADFVFTQTYELAQFTDAKFAKKFNRPALNLSYDDAFQDMWPRRWTWLITTKGLSVETVSKNPDLLIAPWNN